MEDGNGEAAEQHLKKEELVKNPTTIIDPQSWHARNGSLSYCLIQSNP